MTRPSRIHTLSLAPLTVSTTISLSLILPGKKSIAVYGLPPIYNRTLSSWSTTSQIHTPLEGLSWFLEMIEIETENRMEENNRLLAAKGNKVRGNRDAGWRTAPVKIIAGNKCDLKEARVVSSKMGLDWAKSKDCGFMETSARDMVNIEETFACEWTVQLSLLSLIRPGMVRKVVEARRQANGVGPWSSICSTSRHKIQRRSGIFTTTSDEFEEAAKSNANVRK